MTRFSGTDSAWAGWGQLRRVAPDRKRRLLVVRVAVARDSLTWLSQRNVEAGDAGVVEVGDLIEEAGAEGAGAVAANGGPFSG